MNVNALSEWLDRELARREWTYNKLAKNAHLSHSTISVVLSGKVKLTFDFVVAVADALNEPPEKLLRLVGLLRPGPHPGELQELVDTVSQSI